MPTLNASNLLVFCGDRAVRVALKFASQLKMQTTPSSHPDWPVNDSLTGSPRAVPNKLSAAELSLEVERLKEQNAALTDAVVNSAEIIAELEEVKSRLAKSQSNAEYANLNSTRMAETIFEGTHDAMIVLDENFRLVAANQNARRIFELEKSLAGFDVRQYLVNNYTGRKTRDWFQHALSKINHGARIELYRRLSSGEGEDEVDVSSDLQWIELSISRLECDPGEGQYLVTAHDISRRVEVETRFQHQAFHDNVTQLPNRRYFVEQVEALLETSQPGYEFSICFLDLDHFKTVNDTLGHEAGDELLVQVAQRIQGCTRADCVTARFGGDEFALLVPGVPVQTVNLIGQRILAQLQRPFSINGNSVYIGASIGMTRFPDDATDVPSLLQNADVAMYSAKEGGRNQIHPFNKELATQIQERQILLEDVRESVRKRHVNLEYQPKWSLSQNRFAGCEALLRWKRQGIAISPQHLVDVAECSGLILPLGYVIFETAVEQVARWRKQFNFEGKMAINISPRQLADSELVERLCSIVKKHQLTPEFIELEITETAMIENFRDSFGRLRMLQEQGFSIAIDDFGTGYSSLSYLKSFPISTLKIDRSFINDLPNDPKAAAVAKAVLSLGRGLGLEVVAEGVETEAQLEFLKGIGCDQIQGFLLSRSITGHQIPDWIESNRDRL